MKADLATLLSKASNSRINRWIISRILNRIIPFNSAHGIYISGTGERFVEVTLPYIRNNKNHLNGMHACALGTVCEFAAGVSLSRFFSQDKFRIIMKELSMQYHRQAKGPVVVKFNLPENIIDDTEKQLSVSESAMITLISEANDYSGTHICTGTTLWQVKYWEKTKVKR